MTPLRHLDGGHRESHLPKELKELGELAHLLFEWPIRQAPRLALPACILVAAIVQASMIIVFSISYTTPSEIQPSSPQVYFIPPDSAAARQIAPWLAANDPAVFSPQYDTRDALPAPPPLKYRPSYEEPPPPLRPLPAEVASPLGPPSLPELADILRNKSHRPLLTASAAQTTPLPSAAPQTMVHWKDELSTRQLLPGTLSLPLAANASAQPALYEVGVSPEGIPLHCDLLDSSGDPATDEAGSVWIHAQRFQPSAQSGWGRVLLLWGAPAATAKPQNMTKP